MSSLLVNILLFLCLGLSICAVLVAVFVLILFLSGRKRSLSTGHHLNSKKRGAFSSRGSPNILNSVNSSDVAACPHSGCFHSILMYERVNNVMKPKKQSVIRRVLDKHADSAEAHVSKCKSGCRECLRRFGHSAKSEYLLLEEARAGANREVAPPYCRRIFLDKENLWTENLSMARCNQAESTECEGDGAV